MNAELLKRRVIIGLLFTLAPYFISSQVAYDSLYLKNPIYKNLTALYDISKTEQADIVFLGNSITYGGNWSELLGREKVVNCGIGSDNLPGMLHRLHHVYRLHPKICFIMAGINDIYEDVPVDTIFTRYAALLDSLRSKKIIPVIQSTLYVHPRWKRAEVKNREVAVLNARLQQYAHEQSLTFVDLNARLAFGSMLKDEYTTDGVHLTAAAYAEWCTMLEPIVKQHGL